MERKRKTYIQICKCPRCGSEAITTWCPADFSIKCTKCGYGVATTLFHPIDSDETNYSIYLERNQLISRTNLRSLSKLFGKNYIECKTILEHGGLILEGFARDVNEKIDYLKNNHLQFNVKPEWKYYDDPLDNDKEWKRIDCGNDKVI